MKRKSFIFTAVLITLFFAMFMTTCDNPFLPDENVDVEESSMSSVTIYSSPSGVLTTAATANTITITWSAVSNATGYYVYRSSSSSGTYTKVGESLTTSYTNTGLSSSTIYYYKVAAYNKNGAGPQSIFVVAQTQSSSLYTITISGTPKVGQKVTAATSGTGWTGNFNWEYSSSSSASTWSIFSSGTSGLNNSEFVIPAGYTGYYLRVSRQHPSGTWTYSSTGAKNFPSNFLGPIQY